MKTINISDRSWRILKQHALDVNLTIKEIIEKLVEDNIKN